MLFQINNKKDIKLFGQNFINITLKTDQNIRKAKKYYLIIEIRFVFLLLCNGLDAR